MSDPYVTLGLARGASEEEVKSAYKKLAMQFHPDRNKDPAASERMAEINAAYDAIRNPPQQQADPFESFRSGAPPGFEDLFSAFYQQHHRRNRDIQATYTIRLEDAFAGAEFNATLPSGSSVQARVPPGVEDGARLRVPHAGERNFPNLPPGDLYITVRVLPHAIFRRQGESLYVDRQIDAIDAILGTSIDVDLLDGTRVRVTVPPGVQQGMTLRVGDHGMPILHAAPRRGSLYVVVHISIPTALNEAQRAALAAFQTAK